MEVGWRRDRARGQRSRTLQGDPNSEPRSLAAPALGVAAGSGTLSPWSLGSHRKRAQKPPTGGRCPAPRTRDSSLGSGDLLFRITLSKILMRKW